MTRVVSQLLVLFRCFFHLALYSKVSMVMRGRMNRARQRRRNDDHVDEKISNFWDVCMYVCMLCTNVPRYECAQVCIWAAGVACVVLCGDERLFLVYVLLCLVDFLCALLFFGSFVSRPAVLRLLSV